jgi:hypothetical protein
VLGAHLDLPVREEEKADLVAGPEDPQGQVAEDDLAVGELAFEGHAAADVEEDGQAEGRAEIVHEVGDGLLLVVLEDGEVALGQVVDEPPPGILDRDGQGDGPDDVFVNGLVLDPVLGERERDRPKGRQAGKDGHDQDFAFHGISEGDTTKIPRAARQSKAGARRLYKRSINCFVGAGEGNVAAFFQPSGRGERGRRTRRGDQPLR